MMSGRYAEVLTDWTGLAVVTGERQAVVLASLDANQTARLERIELYLPGATEPVAATFAGSLRDYGALVVNAERAVGTAARLAAGDVRTRRGTLLLYADVRVLGASRVVYAGRTWFSALRAGWKDQVEPVIADRSSHVQQQIPAGAGQMALFTFGYDGELVTLPISRRKRVAARQQYGRSEPVVLPSEYLREVLADLPGNVDPGTCPSPRRRRARWPGWAWSCSRWAPTWRGPTEWVT